MAQKRFIGAEEHPEAIKQALSAFNKYMGNSILLPLDNEVQALKHTIESALQNTSDWIGFFEAYKKMKESLGNLPHETRRQSGYVALEIALEKAFHAYSVDKDNPNISRGL